MKYRLITVVLILFLYSLTTSAEALPRKKEVVKVDSVQMSVDYLNQFLNKNSHWIPQDRELERNLKGLVHFVEDAKIDTILSKIQQYRLFNDSVFFYRSPRYVSDSLSIKGYVSHEVLNEKVLQIERAIKTSIIKEEIALPEQLFEGMNEKVRLLDKHEAYLLLRDSLVILPDSLQGFDVIPNFQISNSADFKRLQRLDSLKNAILEDARVQYNNNILQYYIDSVSEDYQNQYIKDYTKRVQSHYNDSIRNKNRELLIQHNNKMVRAVNDSVAIMIDILSHYAEKDSVDVWVKNSEGSSVRVWLRNDAFRYTRMFLKNEQNDSIGIRIQNTAKNAMVIFIDDAVTLNRFSTKKTKSFNFNQFIPEHGLRNIDKRYKVVTPWNMGGNGAFSFTQMAVRNWKKGGKNSLSTLLVLKGFANYSYRKKKWENSIEIRNGWLNPADDKIQKNDDKFEFISRFGLSAFKKWYYSAEIDFQTQLFNGFDYPDRDTKISGFLAPAKTLIKFGLDYKPNKNFSLFLSPFTSKTVFVGDTAHVDATKYGITEGKKRYWEPGLNAELKFKKELTHDITYETKYKMFINYSQPFSKFDVDWENNLSIQLNNYIKMNVLFHLLYDDNVKFNTGRVDDNGDKITKAKWQVKELISIGFSYKLNKPLYRREKLKI